MMPKYQHDCTDCQFLGPFTVSFDDTNEHYRDLYFCPRCDGGSVIARYGDGGPDYSSMPLVMILYAGLSSSHPLVDAARRQIVKWNTGRLIDGSDLAP